MPQTLNSFCLDPQLWTTVLAALAIVLSQLPPVRLWFLPKQLKIEVHSRFQVTHWIGNPNITTYISIRNTGGRELRIQSLQISLTRDKVSLGNFAASTYLETPSSQSPVLFVPFSLKPGDTWAHETRFFNPLDRTTEKLYRGSESALLADIRNKLQLRPKGDEQIVAAESTLVEPFLALFKKLFIWEPGEYVAVLSVFAEPKSAPFSCSYRFTLYESDSEELRSHTEDYKFGSGFSYMLPRHAGVFVPLLQHVDPSSQQA